MQEAFETELQERFMGFSVNDTILRLIRTGYKRQADAGRPGSKSP